jgi:peptidoglycan/xylan/chitin deacetylase (PgdA/CDA1 family)
MLKSLFALLSPGGSGALSILIFHRVHAQRDPLFPGEVTREEFDSICAWLRGWFNVLPLVEASKLLQRGGLPQRALSITFDDGYADNHDVALPVLQKHGLSATFFVATGFLDGGRMWNDTVVEAIRGAPDSGIDLNGTVAASLGHLACASVSERRASVSRAIDATKYLPAAKRERWIATILERSGATLPSGLMMRSDQVAALHRAGMDIGAHTMTHPILANLPVEEARREIRSGRERLQAITGQRVALFAYPNGKPGTDYGDEAVRVVRELGFDAAVSTAWGASRAGTDPFQLRRFSPWDRTRAKFGLRMLRNLAAT